MSIKPWTKQGLAIEGQLRRRSNSDSIYSGRFIKFIYSLSCRQLEQFWTRFSEPDIQRLPKISEKSSQFRKLFELRPLSPWSIISSYRPCLLSSSSVSSLVGGAASRCMMWCLIRLPQHAESPNWISTNQQPLLTRIRMRIHDLTKKKTKMQIQRQRQDIPRACRVPQLDFNQWTIPSDEDEDEKTWPYKEKDKETKTNTSSKTKTKIYHEHAESPNWVSTNQQSSHPSLQHLEPPSTPINEIYTLITRIFLL